MKSADKKQRSCEKSNRFVFNHLFLAFFALNYYLYGGLCAVFFDSCFEQPLFLRFFAAIFAEFQKIKRRIYTAFYSALFLFFREMPAAAASRRQKERMAGEMRCYSTSYPASVIA